MSLFGAGDSIRVKVAATVLLPLLAVALYRLIASGGDPDSIRDVVTLGVLTLPLAATGLAVLVIAGVLWAVAAIDRGAEPEWPGEELRLSSGEKLRYIHDDSGAVWFSAEDVCRIIGLRDEKPDRIAPLQTFGDIRLNGLSENRVQAFLQARAGRNVQARELLNAIRNDILRGLDKQRAGGHVPDGAVDPLGIAIEQNPRPKTGIEPVEARRPVSTNTPGSPS